MTDLNNKYAAIFNVKDKHPAKHGLRTRHQKCIVVFGAWCQKHKQFLALELLEGLELKSVTPWCQNWSSGAPIGLIRLSCRRGAPAENLEDLLSFWAKSEK